MKLISRHWENQLRRRICTEVRVEPTLWKEYKRHRHNRRRQQLTRFSLFALLLVLPGVRLVIATIGEESLIARLILVEVFVVTGLSLWRANGLRYLLSDPAQRQWLAHYPLSRADAFRHNWQTWLLYGTWLLGFMWAFFAGISARHQPVWFQWGIDSVLTGLLQWLVVHSTALCLVVVRRPFGFQLASWILFGLAILALTAPPWSGRFMATIEPGAWWVLPGAWVWRAMTGQWLWFLPVLTLLALSYGCRRHLKTKFLAEPDADLPGPIELNEEDDLNLPPAEAVIAPSELLQLAERIRSGELLHPRQQQPAAWLDRWLHNWLTPVESDGQLLSTGEEWIDTTARWRRAATAAAIGIALAYFFPAKIATWVLAIAIFVSLANFSITSGSLLLLAALYPVRFSDLARVLTKAGLLHWLLWWPIPTLAGGFLAWKWGAAPAIGLQYGAKVALVLLALLPVSIVAHVSGQTNDSRSPHARGRVFFGGIITFLTTLSGVLVFLFTPWWVGLLGLVPAFVAPWCFLWCYFRWFNQMRFDLVPFTAQPR